MRIERVTELSEVMRCLPFEREIRNKRRDDTRESDMLLFLNFMIDNPVLGIWIAYNDDNSIAGYVIAMLNLVPGMQRLCILRMYAKEKELRESFEDILKQWAKYYHVKIAIMTAKYHIKAFAKLWGFTPVSVNLERRI